MSPANDLPWNGALGFSESRIRISGLGIGVGFWEIEIWHWESGIRNLEGSGFGNWESGIGN